MPCPHADRSIRTSTCAPMESIDKKVPLPPPPSRETVDFGLAAREDAGLRYNHGRDLHRHRIDPEQG
eukprot:2232799-Pyramimonas_sp.AAC.1